VKDKRDYTAQEDTSFIEIDVAQLVPRARLMTDAEHHQRKWTAETDEWLRVLWLNNVPTQDIAAELDRTANAIQARTGYLFLPGRNTPNFPDVANTDQWPDGIVFEDDPRAKAELDRAPKKVPADVTAALMGDPEKGQGPPKPRRTLKLNFPTQRE